MERDASIAYTFPMEAWRSRNHFGWFWRLRESFVLNEHIRFFNSSNASQESWLHG